MHGGVLVRRFRHDLHALSGAYAIDAIEDVGERDKFERHMHRCQQCTGEVRGLTDTAGRLGLAASRPPPEQLRDSVLSAISRTRQLPPVLESDARPQGEPAHAKPGRKRRSRTRRPWTGRQQLLVLTFATTSFAITIALAITLTSIWHQLDASRAKNAALTAVLTAPDARARTGEVSAGGRATVVYSLRRHAMIFTPHELKPLPPGEVYELWLIGPPATRPAGLLPAQQAESSPILATGVVRGDVVGVTVEPPAAPRSRPLRRSWRSRCGPDFKSSRVRPIRAGYRAESSVEKQPPYHPQHRGPAIPHRSLSFACTALGPYRHVREPVRTRHMGAAAPGKDCHA